MTWVWKILHGGSRTSLGTDLALLLVRLWVGLPMALVFGRGKLPPPPTFTSAVADMGFPVPTLFAWAAVLAEVIGGALVAIGLMTRPAAFFLAFTMAVAAFQAKGDLSFFDPGRLNPTHFMVLSLVLLFAGSGRLAVDPLLRPKDHRPLGR